MENFLFRDFTVEGKPFRRNSANIIGILFSSATIVFGSLLVVHNLFFESFHLTLKLNKANGIAESAMFLSLDYAFLAHKFGKFVFFSRELSIADFRLRLHKRCSTSRSTNPKLSNANCSFLSCEFHKHGTV